MESSDVRHSHRPAAQRAMQSGHNVLSEAPEALGDGRRPGTKGDTAEVSKTL